MIDPNESAYPYGQVSEVTGQIINGFFAPGMTIRATMAMHFNAAFLQTQTGSYLTRQERAEFAAAEAAALIAELNRAEP